MAYSNAPPIKDLRTDACLLSVTIKMWHAKTKKKELGDQAVDALVAQTGQDINKKRVKGTEVDLVDPDAVAPLESAAASAREYVRINTLPWLKGQGILLARNLVAVRDELEAREREFMQTLVPTFCNNYDALKNAAYYDLGPLWRANDYPRDIWSKFSFGINISQLPTADDIRLNNVSQADLQPWIQKTEQDIKSRLEDAQKDTWQRIIDPLNKLAEKLRAYDPNNVGAGGRKLKGFEQSIIENIVEAAREVPNVNLFNDDNLNTIAAFVERSFGSLDAKQLKEDDALRMDTADKADKLIEQMAQFI